MSNKQRKFEFEYNIKFSGYSRGFKGEPTFMEKLLSTLVESMLNTFKRSYKGLKIEVKKTSDVFKY